MRNPKFYLSFLFSLGLYLMQAQAQNLSQKALWYGYTFHVPISQKWYNETELMERHLINSFQQSQFFVRTRFHKRLSPQANLGLGSSIFLFHHPSKQSFNQPELRPQGELNLKAKMRSIRLENRFRGELRFFQNLDPQTERLAKGYQFAAARFRYRLQALLSILKWSEDKSLHLKIANELMAMAGGKIDGVSFDQNRISADLSLKFSSRVSLDLGYVNWQQARSQGGTLDQHIVRTVVKHQLSALKK